MSELVVTKNTRYGAFASQMAVYNGALTFMAGFVLLCWVGFGDDPFFGTYNRATQTTLVIGVVCGAMGMAIGLWEFWHGGHRLKQQFPRRAILYALFTPFCFLTLPSLFPGMFWVLIIIFDVLSWHKHEEFDSYKNYPSTDEYGKKLERKERILQAVGGRNPEGRFGRLFLLSAYVLGGMIVGFSFYSSATKDINELEDLGQEANTFWVPWAKFFGGLMDLNFSLLFLPVAHKVIRVLITNSVDQTESAVCLRTILTLFPFDQAIKFHKMLGITGFIYAICHVFCHLMNYGQRSDYVWEKYGASVWITGGALLLILLLLIPGTSLNVKRGHFEIFWFTHNLWPIFVALCFLHGTGWWGPNYWKFFVFPGGVYVIERIYREIRRNQPAVLHSVAVMENPRVVNLCFKREGIFKDHIKNDAYVPAWQEGQYALINCPHVSNFEWHPMTISAAPHEECVTFHIRVQGPESWTAKMAQFMLELSNGAVYYEHKEPGQTKPGRVYAPDGTVLFKLDGPNSAPTQHLKQYQDVMIGATGIGVTPVAATMKSVVHKIWPSSSGETYPANANFYWVCSYGDIPSFKWFLRTIREACDAHAHLKSQGLMKGRHLGIHIYLTSYARFEKAGKLRENDGDLPEGTDFEEDAAFWGKPRPKESKLQRQTCDFSEGDLWHAMTSPSKEEVTFGPVRIYNGRPNWRRAFEEVRDHPGCHDKVGVMFCGNPMVGQDLKNLCDEFTRDPKCKTDFNLHKEVF